MNTLKALGIIITVVALVIVGCLVCSMGSHVMQSAHAHSAQWEDLK